MPDSTRLQPEGALPLPRRLWWPWDQPAARVGFDRRFEACEAGQAALFLSSSGPLQVWLDGQHLKIPDSPLPLWRAMRRIPVALSAGGHRLCLEAAPGSHRQPFVMACLDWHEAGAGRRLATDAAWRMACDPAAGWASRPPDEGWRPAWAFDGVWAEPWGMPCDAPDDFCRLSTGWQTMQEAPLVRGIGYPGLAAAGGRAEVGAGGALIFQPVPPYPQAPPALPEARPRLEWYRTREAHSLVNNVWLDLFERRAPHVVLDAGTETFGRVKLRVRSGGPAIVAVTTGESRYEVQHYNRRVTDIVALGDGDAFVTGPTGFRYVKVLALSGGGDAVVLDPVVVQHIRYPVSARGAFACSDDALNAIWEASVRTTHLCMQNEIWDGIKRDQLPWMGDLYVEALAAYHAFGDGRLARRSLAVLGELGPAPARPLEAQLYPGLEAIWRTASGDINDIPTYTLWWLVGLADYVRHTGDATLVEALRPELVAVMAHALARVEADGLWRARDGWDFVDWSPLSEGARVQFSHFLAYQAIELGGRLLGQADPLARDAVSALVSMASAARRRWWRAGQPALDGSHHVAAMAIRSGLLMRDEAQALFAGTLAPDTPARMTYWHRYADLDAALRVGAVEWGLAYIRRHWGPAVEAGLTTLWETFDPLWLTDDDPHALTMVGAEHARYGGYETSLCHGWSAGPVPWLHQAILGVHPTADGFAVVRFTPHLGDLEWADGRIPTPHGEIAVRLRREGDRPVAEIDAPEGVMVTVPEAIRAAWQIV